ncbi:hypothetical protein H0E87_029751 [Populus deltoides]|uniref:Glutamyl-tRNA(Gln) amidotransferase subunit C, chloroplastic/mitochondrial n=1 Tax=Populus deltoides TaxID=3696 RepID=A0A8T2WRR9_POPDE|nr:hypothetical protein H0E87_029751 [Populus deltoides]
MGSRAVLLLKGPSPPKHGILFLLNHKKISPAPSIRRFTTKATANGSSLEPPDVARLAETARISLTPQQVEEFGPKIRQVIDWFGQIQAVDLDSVEPSIRADSEGDNLRCDNPETFENREAIIAAVPNYEDPYVKVPKNYGATLQMGGERLAALELNPILPKPPSKNDTTKKEAFSFIRNSKLILKTKEEFGEQDQSKTGGSKSFYYTAQLACYTTYRPPALMKLHPAFCSISSCCLYWTNARALV